LKVEKIVFPALLEKEMADSDQYPLNREMKDMLMVEYSLNESRFY
tara:strand:+ start:2589 stop:2723 length:135 start_codon:yes stop_codon:yes gene_type:complete